MNIPMTLFQKTLVSSLVFIGLIGFNIAWAGIVTEPIVPCGWGDKPKCDLCHLWKLASNVINFLTFNLSIPIATLLFVAAGILFLISGGNETRIALARSIFTNVVIGLVIIFCSWLLIDTLIKTLVPAEMPEGAAPEGAAPEGTEIIWAWNNFPTCDVVEVPPYGEIPF